MSPSPRTRRHLALGIVVLPATWWSQGTTSWPPLSWMPTPGPVAYQVQPGRFTSGVSTTGLLQEAPSSVLLVSQTVRAPLLVPFTIRSSVSLPRLWVRSSQTVPVRASRTGQGLPQVLAPSSHTTCAGAHVWPPSKLRFRSRSMSPESPLPFLRPSQKASSVPFLVTSSDGMRYVW